MNLKTILVPVDFSERAVCAAQHAVSLAKHFDGKIVLAYVIPPLPIEYAAFDGGSYVGVMWPADQELRANAEQYIAGILRKLGNEVPIETMVLSGDPAREIHCLSKNLPADLVVIPTHGYGPFRRFLMGSVASKVLNDVACPVFTGTHMAELTPFNPEPYKRIACALDLGPHSETVLRWAWDFARAYERDLTIIHVVPRLEPRGAESDWLPPGVHEAVIRNAASQIQDLIAKVGCEARIAVESADLADYLRNFVDNEYIDLLVIGRSPDKGLLGRLRTHAYSIIRESPCPVVSV